MAKNTDGNATKKLRENCVCDCDVCTKICARYRKVHPLFAAIVFIIVIAGGFGLVAAVQCSQANDITNLKSQISQLQTTAAKDSIRANGVSYEGQNGKTALELLKETHDIETKDYGDLGEMVVKIDDVPADDAHFWGFYVDGEMASEGAAKFVTKNGQTVLWKLENIE